MVSIWQRNRLFLLGGIVFSVLLAAFAGYFEMRKAQIRTEDSLKREVAYIQDQLAVIGANMHAVMALISSTRDFQPAETGRFLTLLRTPVAQKRWFWVERVPASDIAQFEAT